MQLIKSQFIAKIMPEKAKKSATRILGIMIPWIIMVTL